MTWEDRPLEKYVESLLTSKLQSEGKQLWVSYLSTRNEIIGEVLPWIAKHGGGLTDHGVEHIRDVIDNACLLLGIPNQYATETAPIDINCFNPHEMLVLLTGLLLHDVGNIYGRNRHNQKIGEVWSKLNAWNSWHDNEKQIIIDVGRAHSGKDKDGSTDTLKALSVGNRYFLKIPVKLAPIASVIRFADELAEGPQRTSKFLIDSKLIEPESALYHQYAQITNVSIDRTSGRVALTYHINIDNSSYPKDKSSLESHLMDLLKMVYSRAAKMNYERQFARHYADILVPFRETSISITFLKSGSTIELPLEPIILNDFCFSSTNDWIENNHTNYKIPDLINKVLGEFESE